MGYLLHGARSGNAAAASLLALLAHLALLALLPACDPDVPEGRYSCRRGHPEDCPAGWVCRADPVTWTYHCFSTTGTPFCGNGRVDSSGEQCDGTDLDGASCQSLGFAYGDLYCTEDCQLNPVLCREGLCGNEVVEPVESCDGTAPMARTCADFGAASGSLACNPDCTFSTLGCDALPTCGNGQIEGTEACDGADLGGHSCQTLGYAGGSLFCLPNCTFGTAGCLLYRCGNGVAETTPLVREPCDGTDLRGLSCSDFGFRDTGGLTCTADCRLDLGQCGAQPSCGNGQLEGFDQCEGDDFGGKSCSSYGFAEGSLACHDNCSVDLSDCH